MLISLLFLFSNCTKEETCNNCGDYLTTNKAEAQKKCDGFDYDLSKFVESVNGADYGIACSDDERARIEGEKSRTKKQLCDGSEYIEIRWVKCDF